MVTLPMHAGLASVPALCNHLLRQVCQRRAPAENQAVRFVPGMVFGVTDRLIFAADHDRPALSLTLRPIDDVGELLSHSLCAR